MGWLRLCPGRYFLPIDSVGVGEGKRVWLRAICRVQNPLRSQLALGFGWFVVFLVVARVGLVLFLTISHTIVFWPVIYAPLA